MDIALIGLVHYALINPLEKRAYSVYFKENVLRPRCPTNEGTNCLGMPSGHAETVTVVCVLLYTRGKISLQVALSIIFLVCIQRIIAKEHTVLQVLAGCVLGVVYSKFYKYTLFTPLLLVILLVVLLIYKIDKYIENMPSWADKVLVNKKKNVSYYMKVMTILYSVNKKLYLSWDQLEAYLDTIVFDLSGNTFDAVVGLKTGGAIISDYISNKLKIKNYKIKISDKDYKCNKKEHHLVDYLIKTSGSKEKVYTVCEGIDDDLTGKNILLVDELVYSGTTMSEAVKYLQSKGVKSIKRACIFKDKKSSYDGYYVSTEEYYIYPWGYDN